MHKPPDLRCQPHRPGLPDPSGRRVPSSSPRPCLGAAPGRGDCVGGRTMCGASVHPEGDINAAKGGRPNGALSSDKAIHVLLTA